MGKIMLATVSLCALALTGCESLGTAAQSRSNQGAVLGSLLGAGTGSIIGNQSDHAGAGTAVGAALGALGGGLIGHSLEEQERRFQQQQLPLATGQAHSRDRVVKYSPTTGKEYPAYVNYDPETGVELRVKEQ